MDFAPPRRTRRLVSLTPMIDVVFLLLVFFMLASEFTTERTVSLSGGTEGGTSEWQGAPRLLEVAPERLKFNGQAASIESLGAILMNAGVTPDLPILIRILDDTDVQRLTDTLDALNAAGFGNPVLLP